MKPTFVPTLFFLAVLTQLSLAQINSEIFSQFVGAPTVSAAFAGTSATYQSMSLTICTHYLHGLQPVNNLPTSAIPQIEQIQVDGVCQFCTSLSQSRIDSCCGVASSVACFEQFAPGKAVQKTHASTPAANSATATGGTGSAAATTKSSSGNKADAVGLARLVLAMLSFIGLALL